MTRFEDVLYGHDGMSPVFWLDLVTSSKVSDTCFVTPDLIAGQLDIRVKACWKRHHLIWSDLI